MHNAAGNALLLATILLALLSNGGHAASDDATDRSTAPAQVVMVTWRGCEDACEGFKDYLETLDLESEITVLDAARDRARLPDFVTQVNAMQPDLLVTWGTSVTLGMIGTGLEAGAAVVSEIPAVFMIVADPVGAGIIDEYSRSGRPFVTGTHNRVPEETQMRVLADYLPFSRIGLIYNDDELNAVLKAEEIKRVGEKQGFEVVERLIAKDADGVPLASDIPNAVSDISKQDVDFIYVGSSSFLLEHAQLFTGSAMAYDLPVATAYEAMVRDAQGLIALASAYYNVGQLAGFQAEQILVNGAMPGDLEVLGLDRFSVLVNMDAARRLGLYPPMLLLRYAEVVGDE